MYYETKKYQITSTKLQIIIKSQYPIIKTCLRFGVLEIGICLYFDISD
ncbi:hypothetical protein D1AOALGA4SA_2663 [Olavius algarvensis Delta 1 endosymbiont]|nr:hypothetical protein D1AOALGA4SA_2663 [Olavius algarvensis Delta 1 endosymbiont]